MHLTFNTNSYLLSAIFNNYFVSYGLPTNVYVTDNVSLLLLLLLLLFQLLLLRLRLRCLLAGCQIHLLSAYLLPLLKIVAGFISRRSHNT